WTTDHARHGVRKCAPRRLRPRRRLGRRLERAGRPSRISPGRTAGSRGPIRCRAERWQIGRAAEYRVETEGNPGQPAPCHKVAQAFQSALLVFSLKTNFVEPTLAGLD